MSLAVLIKTRSQDSSDIQSKLSRVESTIWATNTTNSVLELSCANHPIGLRESYIAQIICTRSVIACGFQVAWIPCCGTLEDDRTVLYKTKSLDGTKPYTNPKANPNQY